MFRHTLKEVWKRTGNIHHAYVIGSFTDTTPTELAFFLKELVSPREPDVRILISDTLGIDEVRQLRRDQSLSSVDTKQFFIIKPRVITIEAQNALLKTIEEPARDTHFFLCVDENILLPTLKSRVVVLPYAYVPSRDTAQAQNFLKGTFLERILLVRELADKKNNNEVEEFLKGLEEELYTDIAKNKEFLTTIIMTRKYLRSKSANTKLLLDNIALSFPPVV